MTEQVFKERRLLWVAALESGEYTQGSGVLSDEDGDCCLGVACKVAIANGLDVQVETETTGSIVAYDGAKMALPQSVQDWYGLDSPDPRVRLLEEEQALDHDENWAQGNEALSVINDTTIPDDGRHVADFGLIARLIRRDLVDGA